MMKLLIMSFAIFFFSLPSKLISLIFFILVLQISFSKNLFIMNFFGNYNMDLISITLIILSIFLIPMMFLSQLNMVFKNTISKMYLMLLLSLQVTFLTNNIFLFYFFFEWSLIPIFLIILGWGYQPERLKASLALFFYTMFASLPLLLMIFKLFLESFTLSLPLMYTLMSTAFLKNNTQFLFFLILAFLVKFPMFLVHMWLPKAHTEAPVSGSMILAGVLLKLGGYGLYRFFVYFSSSFLSMIIITISLMGGSILSVLCVSQSDLKVVIAYSSVVHMALVIVGFLSISKWGVEGGMMIMLAHGLCSSGMFAGANMMYERTHSRSYFINTGYLIISPFFSMFWFLMLATNFGGPFTYNLLGEILLIINMGQMSKLLLGVLCFLSFFSAAYSLILYSSTQQGQLNNLGQYFFSMNIRENLLLYSHVWPLFMLPLSASLI